MNFPGEYKTFLRKTLFLKTKGVVLAQGEERIILGKPVVACSFDFHSTRYSASVLHGALQRGIHDRPLHETYHPLLKSTSLI